MIEYWTHLTPTMKTFVGLGAISSVVLTLQMILAMFGGDMDGLDADMDVPDVGEGGASGILSIRTIGAFFTGFGWSGAAMLQAGHGTGAATFVGIVVGSIFMALIFYLMAYLHSLRQEGTIDYANAGKWAEKNQVPYTTFTDLAQKEGVYELVKEHVDRMCDDLPEAARICRFLLLHKELDADDAELTRTRKVRRRFVAERYNVIVDALYRDDDKVAVETEITYQDGRTAVTRTELRIESLRVPVEVG